jgi:hypothetical protein
MGGRFLKRKRSLLCYIAIIFHCLFLYSCVFPFEPKIDKYENLLVIEGMLTNEPGSCLVKLSRTYTYDNRNPVYETDATVSIIDELGNVTYLKDNLDGYYLPEDNTFSGITGRKYKLSVFTASGEIIESDFEELKEPVPIGKIYHKYADKGNGIAGIQIYVDTYDPDGKSFYYAWEFVETWEFIAPFASDIYPSPEQCFITASSSAFIVASTKAYKEDRLIEFPLYFVDNRTNRLRIKYSTLVKQYILTEKSYLFYENVKSTNENVGTLFDRMPLTLAGNMRNLENPEIPVLGNFQVSGVSEMRIFVVPSELPVPLYTPSGLEYCESLTFSKPEHAELIDSLLKAGWLVLDTLFMDDEVPETMYNLTNSRSCFDCSLNGNPEKPVFWE